MSPFFTISFLSFARAYTHHSRITNSPSTSNCHTSTHRLKPRIGKTKSLVDPLTSIKNDENPSQWIRPRIKTNIISFHGLLDVGSPTFLFRDINAAKMIEITITDSTKTLGRTISHKDPSKIVILCATVKVVIIRKI